MYLLCILEITLFRKQLGTTACPWWLMASSVLRRLNILSDNQIGRVLVGGDFLECFLKAFKLILSYLMFTI